LKRLIVITGATACGKTAMSVKLAQQLNTEIISCDSRQFYKEMSIGTAKPTTQEMDGIKHHFVDSHSVLDEVNAGKFERLALPVINTLFETHDDVILTGGSGLFIDAIINGFDDMPIISKETRENLNAIFSSKGIDPLYQQLKELDPDYAKEMDSSNPKRVIRALEVCLTSKKTYSELRTGQKAKRQFTTLKIVLDWPRKDLYERINLRVEQMMDNGLEEEVKSLFPYRDLNALKTVGYKEFFDYLDGNTTKERAIELTQQNSRRYAKRQLTWFRRDKTYRWIEANNYSAILEVILNDN
jgi:tRNA dimethylallyltransferase